MKKSDIFLIIALILLNMTVSLMIISSREKELKEARAEIAKLKEENRDLDYQVRAHECFSVDEVIEAFTR